MCTALRSQMVRTKKNHRCHGCERMIPRGTLAKSWASVDHGDFSAGYCCLDCIEYAKKSRVFENGDCIMSGDFWEEFHRLPILIPIENAGVA